ncbi:MULTISPECIES: hypothetical protein [Flavobacteriaceae]|uniref:hypothetical protein n=1 Tax=Flavobacteriaceae TaxID=49546 RepID=UPI002349A0E6|nr:hypothetical protein [Muricauda sp. SP22]MDC6361657.1 hypothetical protein [Muricauda sp. SP22]
MKGKKVPEKKKKSSSKKVTETKETSEKKFSEIKEEREKQSSFYRGGKLRRRRKIATYKRSIRRSEIRHKKK